ncbi:MAG: WHG domain-containing protein [Clostridiales bacterium]|nr:WHG domain-containing protein [Clostridiales bacterium]
MPPKAKFTREEVIVAALDVVREKGESALTARELGACLKSSARPVFTLFSGMDEVLREVVRAARDLYNNGYIAEGLKETPAFKGVGRAYLRFAVEEPQLFRLLFMQKHDASIHSILPILDENYADILASITNAYNVSGEQADRIYRHLWVYTHGIATLVVPGACAFTEEETNGMLTEIFIALLARTKSEGKA